MPDYQSDFLKAMEAERKPGRVEALSRFFKTGPGQYGEGDIFWGIQVPPQQRIAKQFYKHLSLDELSVLLTNPVHEIRLTTLTMLVYRFQKSKDQQEKDAIAEIYLSHTDYINSWDLVDLSAPYITGPWFFGRSHAPLLEMAHSSHLWKQRIAMLTTYYFIKNKSFDTAFVITEILLHHPHDLIHKAVGWMLREIGKRDYQAEYSFLLKHYKTMPRTMLRYAIEKFAEPVRQAFLKGTI